MNGEERYIHDGYMALCERTIKRLWILCIVVFIALVGSNIAWIVYESQFVEEETITIDATQDGEGVNIVSGGDAANVSESQNN